MTLDEALSSSVPVIRTTYPGQGEAYVAAPLWVIEHYDKANWDLPFVEPIGQFAKETRVARAHRRASA
jgi:hypothetical protein